MSLRNRIAAIERKTGVSRAIPVVYFRTIYEDQNGDPESEKCEASLFPGPGQQDRLSSMDSETFEEFEQRVRAHCQKCHGRNPKDD